MTIKEFQYRYLIQSKDIFRGPCKSYNGAIERNQMSSFYSSFLSSGNSITAATGMSQATEAMAKGPAPIKDNKAVTAGIPNTTSMLTRLLELSWFKTLVRFVFSSIEVVCNAFEFVEDAGRGGIVTSILATSANIIDGLNVGL